MSTTAPAGLDRITLLSGLAQEQLNAIAARCAWHRYPAGRMIIAHDSAVRDFLMVVQGHVRVVAATSSGREVVYAEIAAGGHVGELAAIDGGPRSASVVTVTDCLIASMPPATLRELLLTHPMVTLALLRDFARMVRLADERIMEVSTMGAVERICRELLRVAHPGRDGQLTIDALPTQELIASITGTTRETVGKVMARLAQLAVVRRRQRRLIVLDPRRLEALAGTMRAVGPAGPPSIPKAHQHDRSDLLERT